MIASEGSDLRARILDSWRTNTGLHCTKRRGANRRISNKIKHLQINYYLLTQKHELIEFKLMLAFWDNKADTGLKTWDDVV